MRLKTRLRVLIPVLVNIAAAAGIVSLTACARHTANAQKYNFTAEKWQGETEDQFSQISCFFSGDSDFYTSRIRSVRGQLMTALANASFNTDEKLFADAYSSDIGTAQVRCDTSRRCEADVTAAGGDFFFFHSFDLISGAYFNEDDIMHDGAVIDRELAWELYGSDDVAGKDIYLNGVKCYISAVVSKPDDKASKRCAGDSFRAYVSYDTAMAVRSSDAQETDNTAVSDNSSFPVDSYECVLPEPVNGYGKKLMKDIFEQSYKDNVRFVYNTERFTPAARKKAFRHISDSVIHDDSIKLPYWENASRIAEYKLSWMYTLRKWLCMIPTVTVLYLAYKGYRMFRNRKVFIFKRK